MLTTAGKLKQVAKLQCAYVLKNPCLAWLLHRGLFKVLWPRNCGWFLRVEKAYPV